MKAVVYPIYGSPDVMEIMDVPDPRPDADGVLVKISYAGVNPIDWKIGEGRLKAYFDCDFPLIVGRDLAGTVEQVGSRVKNFSPGDKVLAALPRPGGAFAQYVALPASYVSKAPQRLSLKEGASLPLVALTCWQSLVQKAGLASGQTIFILSGAGGTGSLAVQIACAKGATVVTTCSPINRAYVESLGAQHVFDYSRENVIGEIRARFPGGIDVVFSNVLGELHERAYGALKAGGMLVTIGEPPIPDLANKHQIDEFDLVVRPDGSQLGEIVRLTDDGKLQPPAITEFAFEDCADAMRKSMSGHSRGKIVVRIERS